MYTYVHVYECVCFSPLPPNMSKSDCDKMALRAVFSRHPLSWGTSRGEGQEEGEVSVGVEKEVQREVQVGAQVRVEVEVEVQGK